MDDGVRGIRRLTRRDFLKVSGAGVAGLGLFGVYGCGGGEQSGSASVRWSTWGNPGEVKRFQEYTDKFNEEHDVQVNFRPIPNLDEYESKLLTQFNGGTGPDLWYSFDNNVGTWIDRGIAREITEMITGPDSKSSPDQFFDGLWGGTRTGEDTYYGAPVDCNPLVFWYNKKVLRDAGVSEDPVDLFERGEWSWEAFQGMLERVNPSGAEGFVLGAPGFETFSWATSNGGRVLEGDRFVMHEDPKSVEAHEFLYDNLQNGNMIYAATLSGNQGPETLFMSNRVAFVPAGRWYLPVFRENPNLEFDIVPWPANTGNKIEPVAIAEAYMLMASQTENPEAAFEFFTNYISKEGQIFRLQGQGNAVPSVRGADEVVLESDLPEHAQYFLDAREIGYAYPGTLSSVPGVNQTLVETLEPVLINGGDIVAALTRAGERINQMIQEQAGG